MKRITLILAMVAIYVTAVIAQNLTEGEMAIVYYMPKNSLDVEVTYNKVCLEVGPFYQYSERFLGTKDVILRDETYYELAGINLNLTTEADRNRAYKVIPQKGMQTQLLSLTEKGILYGYNVCYAPQESNLPPTLLCETASVRRPMPLLEEQMMASSTAKMAEGAAKQIYHIRESRLAILAGEVDHAPADGESMRLVLQKLDEQEQTLVELFIGKRTVTTYTEHITYTPTEDVVDFTLLRFSRFAGPVSADDLSGEVVSLSVRVNRQELRPADKKVATSPIYYNLPGSAEITLTYRNKTFVNRDVLIAQFGVAIPVSLEFFSEKQVKMPKIRFNTENGNIQFVNR